MLNIRQYNPRVYKNAKKWKRQRVTRGFADVDTWNLDLHLLTLLPEMIDHLAKNSHGWPQSEQFPEFKDWQNYLFNISNKMRRAYHLAAEAMPLTCADMKENDETADKLIKEALHDLGEVFFSLWD